MLREVKPVRRRKAKQVGKLQTTASLSRPRSIRGHGDYAYGDKKNMGPWEKTGRFIGSALGGTYGKSAGKLGEKLGSYLHYIGKIFGSGDYVTSAQQVKQNSLVNSSQIPQFAHGKNTVRIQHREYLGDVITSATAGAFSIQSFPINPGISTTFPWLYAVVGGNWQQYRINGMVFEFRTMSGDALTSTNTALGSVVMATDYDSTDQRFQSKAQMENTEFGVSCKPSSCMIHAIECARAQTSINEQYVRYNAPLPNADIRLYDLGLFSIATVGMQGSSVNIGELWVSYDIEFLKPISNLPLVIAQGADYSLVPVSSSFNSHPLGNGLPTINGVDQIGLTFSSDGTKLYFPANLTVGTSFMIIYSVSGSSTAISAGSITGSNGMYVGSIWGNNSVTTANYQVALQVYYQSATPAGSLPTITWATFTGPASASLGELYVQQTGQNVYGAP